MHAADMSAKQDERMIMGPPWPLSSVLNLSEDSVSNLCSDIEELICCNSSYVE